MYDSTCLVNYLGVFRILELLAYAHAFSSSLLALSFLFFSSNYLSNEKRVSGLPTAYLGEIALLIKWLVQTRKYFIFLLFNINLLHIASWICVHLWTKSWKSPNWQPDLRKPMHVIYKAHDMRWFSGNTMSTRGEHGSGRSGLR